MKRLEGFDCPARGAELAQAMKARCEVSRQDAGCEQFEVFQSVFHPDKLVLLELWKDQVALDAHAELQARRPPLPEGLRLGAGEREDYTYNWYPPSGALDRPKLWPDAARMQIVEEGI